MKKRKDIIDAAKTLKINIWQRVNKDVKLYKQAIRQLCNKYYTPNNQGQLLPYAFVTVAVLTA